MRATQAHIMNHACLPSCRIVQTIQRKLEAAPPTRALATLLKLDRLCSGLLWEEGLTGVPIQQRGVTDCHRSCCTIAHCASVEPLKESDTAGQACIVTCPGRSSRRPVAVPVVAVSQFKSASSQRYSMISTSARSWTTCSSCWNAGPRWPRCAPNLAGSCAKRRD